MKKTIAGTILCIATLIPNCYQHACLAQQASSQKRASQVSQILAGKMELTKTNQGKKGSHIRLVGAQSPVRSPQTQQQQLQSNPLVPLQATPTGTVLNGSPLKPLISKKNAGISNPFRPLVLPKKNTVKPVPGFVPTPIIRPISTTSNSSAKRNVVQNSQPVPVVQSAPKGNLVISLPSPVQTTQSRSSMGGIPIVQQPVPNTTQPIVKKQSTSIKVIDDPYKNPIVPSSTATTRKKAGTKPAVKQIESGQWTEIETENLASQNPKKTQTDPKTFKKTSLASKTKSDATRKNDAVNRSTMATTSEAKQERFDSQKLKQQLAGRTEDQIKVEEFSNDQLIDMILNERESGSAPSVPSVVNSSIVPRPKRTKAKTFQVSNAKQVLHGDQEHFGDIQPEPISPNRNGLNFTNSRPACVDHLKYDGCGSVSGAHRYLIAEALYYDRSDGNFSASAVPGGDGFSYNWGGRVTIGQRFDSIEGWEMSFTGIDSWNRQNISNSPGGALFSRLAPVGGFTPITLAGFTNAFQHVQTQQGHYTSFELNRMNWNWDVLSTFVGFRYNGVDDQYALTGISALASNSYQIRARNNMVGLQLGGEFFYDIGKRISFSGKGKIAGYLNIVQTDTELFFNNSQLVDNQDEETNLAWGLDLGFYTRYNLSPRSKLKFGYEFSYLGELALVQNQFNGFISPFSGLDLQDDEDVFIHGAVFGIEWYR